MPRSCIKQKKPQYPPIDWLLAAILERKHALKVNWQDVAHAAGISYDAMRWYVSQLPPEEWSKEVREKVCAFLGIEVKLVVSGYPGEEGK